MPDEYDVFLSHNSRDKPAVEEVAARLAWFIPGTKGPV